MGTALLGVAALVMVLWITLWFRARIDARLTLQIAADAIHFVDTKDGARLALLRYVPKNPRPDECPVVLCHGAGANRFNFDFDERLSLARYLRSRGYDVFVVELRGTGLSTTKAPPSFDDFVSGDVPALIDAILQLTGAEKVNWVGHSLGGLVMYGALGGPVERKVNSLIALGSPATLAGHRLLRRIAFLYPLLRPVLGGTTLARIAALLAGSWTPGFSALANLKNVDGRVIRRALWSMVGTTSVRLLDTFVQWLRQKSGPTEKWSDIHIPLLLMAGQGDWCLAPPSAVRHAYYHASSVEKEFVILSKLNGFKADYGHGDLIIGKHAPDEVFPLIEKFLWNHRRACEPVKKAVA